MKKILSIIISLTLIASGTPCANAETIDVTLNSVNLVVNGESIQTPNILWNGTTYVPIRAVSESLGCDVSWYDSTRTADISNYNKTSFFTALNDLYRYRVAVAYSEGILVGAIVDYYNAIVLGAGNIDEVREDCQVKKDSTIKTLNSFVPSAETDEPYSANIFASAIATGYDYTTFRKTLQTSTVYVWAHYMDAISYLDKYRKDYDPIHITDYSASKEKLYTDFETIGNTIDNFTDVIYNAY